MRVGETQIKEGRTSFVLAGLFVIASGLVLLRIWDAPAGSSLIYLGFQLAYVILPGVLVYRVLNPDPGALLRQLAIGWALGYVILVFAFMLTAELGVRPLLDFLPLLIGVPAGVLLWWRRPAAADGSGSEAAAISAGLAWWIAGVCVMAMAWIAIANFPISPLPGTTTINYFPDFSWTLAIAADALHHWPMMDPGVAGEPFPYHDFIHFQLAATTQVTGIDLPLVFLRFWFLPVTVLIVLLFVEAGRSLLGAAGAGLIAAALMFFIGDFDLPYNGIFFSLLTLSPSFMYGLIVLLPLILLIGERLRAGPGRAAGQWILLLLFAAAAGGAKISILPVLIGAVAIYGVWIWIRERRFPVKPLAVGLILVAAQAVYYLLLYRGHTSGLGVDPASQINVIKGFAGALGVESELLDLLPGLPGLKAVVGVGSAIVSTFAMLAAPLAGLIWVLRRRNMPFPSEVVWLFSGLLTGLVFLFFITSEGSGNQLYFVFYGFMAGLLLSGIGIHTAWSERRGYAAGRTRMIGLLVAWAVILAVPLFFPSVFGRDDFFVNLSRTYAFIGIAAILFTLAAVRLLKGVPGAAAVVLAAGLLMGGLVDTPGDTLESRLKPTDPPTTGYRMSPDLYGALAWLRTETSDDAVFLVNNQVAESFSGYATDYDYPAFSERRAFFAGWGYATRTRDAGFDRVRDGFNPFAERERLNDLAFAGDPAAISELKLKYGVGYAVIDRVNGDPADLEAMKKSGTVVYETPDAVVVKFDD